MSTVQVVYASRHGGTAGIAERIADVLRSEGADVVVANSAERPEAGDFDAYVIGSGVQIGSWFKEGTEFLERNQSKLATKPVWLFSSGPLPGSSKTTAGTDSLTLALGPEEGPGAGAVRRSRRCRPGSILATIASSMVPSTLVNPRSRWWSGSFA